MTEDDENENTVERKVAFEADEPMEVIELDVPWDGDFAKDLSDALFEVLVAHNPQRFAEGVVDNPNGVKCTHINVTVSVHEDGTAEVIVPERYTP